MSRPAKLLRAQSRLEACLLLLLLACFFGCSAGYTQQPFQVMRHHVRPEVENKTAALVGSLPSDQELTLSFVLPLQNQASLTSLLSRLYDPASPDFHHFLTVAQFTDQFGPSADSFNAVVAFAQANGLSVTETPANRLVVPVTGSVQAISKALGVSMKVYQHPTEDRTFFSPDREPSLPAGLRVAHVSGLNNFSLPRPRIKHPQSVHPLLNGTGSGPGGSYLGSDMRAAYYGGTTLTGLGQSIGLLEFTGYDVADVNSTFANAGQTYTVPVNNVLLDGATGKGTAFEGEGEVVLDIVQAIGMAPGLDQVRVYIGVGTDDPAILNKMASENITKVISCSWGWLPEDPEVDDVFFQEFAAQGQSFLTASGDSGAFDSSISPFFYPQEDAYVTAVGGTHLTTTGPGGGWTAETVWNSDGSGSGGGISPDDIGIPSWQTGLANSANAGSNTLRNVPDVAMEGDFDNYSCEVGSCSGGWAGTSFAAPRWAGYIALVNQQAVEAGTAPQGGIGFINPAVYRLAQDSKSNADFHDITSGNNQTNNQSTWFSAVSGYDLVTGWGSANGQSLIDALAGPQLPGFWLQASSPHVNINRGSSASTTISVVDAGGFSSPVALALPSTLPSGVTASWGTNPTSGSSVLTLTADSTAPPSTTAITVSGTSGTLTAQATLEVAVHAPTFALSASPNPVSLNQGQTTTTTLTVSPEYGFDGAVDLSVSGLPSGVTAAFGTNPTSGTSVLTIAASSSAIPATTPLTITGTSGALSVTLSIPLNIHGPSFTLSNNPSLDIGQGSSTRDYVYVSGQYGFTGNVNLAVTGLPAGVTGTFSPNPATGPSTLTLNATTSAAPGISTLTVTGTSGNLTASTTTTLQVHVPSFTLSNPGNINVGQGSSATSYLYVSPQYGFNGSVTLAVSGLPAGVTALWSPNPTSSNTTLTLAVAPTAAVGQYPLTITGNSGSQSVTTSLVLKIYQPTFTLYAGSVSLGQGTTSTAFVDVTPQYGFTGSVNLTASNLPPGVTATFSPNPTTGYSTATFTASSSAPTGQYTVTLTGTSGAQTATTTLALGIYQPTFSLSGPVNVSLGQGTSTSSSIFVNPQYGFSGSVNLVITGLPAGVTVTASPNPTTGYAALTFTASDSAALGQYVATLTGTSGSQTVTTHITVGVFTPTFTLSSPGSLSLGQGSAGTTYVYLNNQYGFKGSVSLAVGGLPAGVTAAFSPNPTSTSTMLTLTAASTAALGQYNLTITGTAGGQTSTTTLTLGVYAPTFSLSSSSLLNIGQGTSANSYVYVNKEYGFTGNVTLAVSGLPSGVTAALSPNPSTGTSMLTLTATEAALQGQYPVTITGTSGVTTASTTLTIGVYAPSFSLSGGYGGVSLDQGGNVTASFYITDQYGFNSPVSMSASGLPSGVLASFAPNPTTSATTVTLTASNTATPGQATVTITGTAGAVTASTPLTLTVNASAFALVTAPSQISIPVEGSVDSVLRIVPQNGFTGAVNLAITGLPAGVTGTFSANAITSTGVLTLHADSSATPGTAIATITGTSGSLVVTAPLQVTVSTAPSSTETSLVVTSSGGPVTSVPSHTAVTLTAKVTSGKAAITGGQVLFCDTTAASCDSTHLVGTAQLTSAGSAALTMIPGPGTHAFKATFSGRTGRATSSSASADLAVTASQVSSTSIAQSGSAGQYTLTATVSGQGAMPPSGSVAFRDLTNGDGTLATATLVPTQPALTLASAQTTATSFSPFMTAAADFNGDGIPDLASINPGGNSLSIFLGKGDGAFSVQGSPLPTGNQPSSVVAADFNADGKIDLAVANNSSNSISIFLGNGTGSFDPVPLSPQTGSFPYGMVAADFDGDGKLDLAVANESSASLTILLGNGDGSFSPSHLSPQTGSSPVSLATADFNGDGILDIAVINNQSSTLSMLLGNGDGSFASAGSVATPSSPVSLATGDFNNDGKPDLAIVSSISGAVSLLLGKGDSTFTVSSIAVPQMYLLSYVTAADLNGDGKEDLVVAGYGKAVALLGNGDGTFTPGPSATLGGGAPLVAIADVNGDGVPDLLTPNNYANNIAVFAGQLAQSSRATSTGINPAGKGDHAVEASYAGDIAWKSSISSPTQLTAQIVAPSLTAIPASASVTTAQPIEVKVTVAAPGGNPIPTGTISVSGGTYSSAPAVLSGGIATISVPAGSLAAGTVTLAATYTPDAAASGMYTSSSTSFTVTITSASRIAPTLTVTPASASITTAQSLTVAVALSGPSGSAVPGGSVILSGAGFTSAPVGLSSGSASISIPAGALAPGTGTLAVSYTPDSTSSATYAAAIRTISITVSPVGTTVATVNVTPSATSVTDTQSVTVTVAVVGSGFPTGIVTLSTGHFTAQQTLAAGVATFTLATGTFSDGQNTLTATYSGDPTFAPANGTAVVTASPLTMTASSPVPIVPGGVGSSTVTFNTGSYNGTLKLDCALTSSPSGAQNLPTCTLTPSSVQVASGTKTTSLLTISTTAATSALAAPSSLSGTLGFGAPALASFLLLLLPSRRRLRLPLLTLLLGVLATSTIGCGSGGPSSTPRQTTAPATTSGQYSFTVTGTDATNPKISVSTAISVTVQ